MSPHPNKRRRLTRSHQVRLPEVRGELILAADAAEEGQEVASAIDGVGEPLHGATAAGSGVSAAGRTRSAVRCCRLQLQQLGPCCRPRLLS